jgi:hypothetical protein
MARLSPSMVLFIDITVLAGASDQTADTRPSAGDREASCGSESSVICVGAMLAIRGDGAAEITGEELQEGDMSPKLSLIIPKLKPMPPSLQGGMLPRGDMVRATASACELGAGWLLSSPGA